MDIPVEKVQTLKTISRDLESLETRLCTSNCPAFPVNRLFGGKTVPPLGGRNWFLGTKLAKRGKPEVPHNLRDCANLR
jgi:hypothetical protein